jgi:hypothetical protein
MPAHPRARRGRDPRRRAAARAAAPVSPRLPTGSGRREARESPVHARFEAPPPPGLGAHRGFPRWAGEREGGHWTVRPEVSGRQMAAGCRSTLPPSASLSRGTRREREARRGARAGVRRPRPHSSDPRPSPQFNHGPRSSLAFASHQQCCAEPEVPHRAKPVIALGHSALRPRDGVPSGPSWRERPGRGIAELGDPEWLDWMQRNFEEQALWPSSAEPVPTRGACGITRAATR